MAFNEQHNNIFVVVPFFPNGKHCAVIVKLNIIERYIERTFVYANHSKWLKWAREAQNIISVSCTSCKVSIILANVFSLELVTLYFFVSLHLFSFSVVFGFTSMVSALGQKCCDPSLGIQLRIFMCFVTFYLWEVTFFLSSQFLFSRMYVSRIKKKPNSTKTNRSKCTSMLNDFFHTYLLLSI